LTPNGVDELRTLVSGDHHAAGSVLQTVDDFALGRVVADGNADRAGPGDGEAGFDPANAVGQEDCDLIARADAEIGKMTGKVRRSRSELAVGDLPDGILECGLISPLPGLSLDQRGDRRNQIGLHHASSALAVIVVKAC
jgi:hypothetical protein